MHFDLEMLEFQVVKGILLDRLSTPLGRHAVQRLAPFAEPERANTALAEAREIAHRLEQADQPPLGQAVELRSWLGAFIAGEHQPKTRDLADLKKLLRSSLACRGWLRSNPDQAALCRLAGGFPGVGDMFAELDAVVDDRGEVLSSASQRLAELRQEIDATESAVRSTAASYAAREEIRRCLQTTEPAWRHGRPVLQVRQEMRQGVPGVLHDRSQSGATLFIEPACVVAVANRLSDARAAEHREIQVILAEICRSLRRCHAEIESALAAVEGLDLAVARAKLIHDDGYYPAPVVVGGNLRLRHAVHPILLLHHKPGATLVPLDLDLGDPYRMLVITGPNTGGKTVALKTIGLLSAMALCGLPIPAQAGSQIPHLQGIYADIGDAQGISQNLSTFSAHVTRISLCLSETSPHCLVLLDELGAGTDPDEGGSLGLGVLEEFERLGTLAVVTTHLGRLKDFAYTHSATENGSMAFDGETLRPLFHLEVGIPGASHALDIATRVGMPETLVERARELLGCKDHSLEQVIDQVQKARMQAEDERQRTQQLRSDAESIERDLSIKRMEIDRRQAWLEEEAGAVMEEELRAARTSLEAPLREFRNAPRPYGEKAETLLTRLKGLMQATTVHRRRMRFLGRIRKGSRVYVPTLQKCCTVKKVDRPREVITIEAGTMRLEVPFEDVSWLQPLDPDERS